MIQPEIIIYPAKLGIPAKGGTLDVVLRVQAPDQPADLVPGLTPIRLALVIDKSGSLWEPLAEAFKFATYVAGRMTAADQLALVVYDDVAKTLLPLHHAPACDMVEQTTDERCAGGRTNLFGGWQEGARQLEGGKAGSISRVILMSDGQINRGLDDEDAIIRHCSDWHAMGISTSTIGLGLSVNEGLLTAMARAGGGQQYYGWTTKELQDCFDEEFSLLQALCLQQLEVMLMPAPGVIVEPIGLVQQNADSSFRLGNLAWGAEARLALRLHISPGIAGSTRELLGASLRSRNRAGKLCNTQASPLRLPVLDQQALDALPAAAAIEYRLLEARFAKASQAFCRLVNRGDSDEAFALLDELDARFSHHPWLRGRLFGLREFAVNDLKMMMKEAEFSSEQMARCLVGKEPLMCSADQSDALKPPYLRH
jgi:Ca-activated chloride channel family protein